MPVPPPAGQGSAGSPVDARLGAHTGPKRVLQIADVADRVGGVDQCLRRRAAGDDHMLHGWAGADVGQHGRKIEVAVAEQIGQLVQHHQIHGRIGQRPRRHRPAGAGGGDVPLAVLRLPRETVAAHLPVDTRLAAKKCLLAGVAAALDELHHGGFLPVPQGPRQHAKRRTGLALAGAGQHQQQALVLPMPLQQHAAGRVQAADGRIAQLVERAFGPVKAVFLHRRGGVDDGAVQLWIAVRVAVGHPVDGVVAQQPSDPG